MTVTAAELAALSRLLDEAMDLPMGEREAWLAALPAADQPLVPMLREMLAEQSGQSGASHPDFLNALPKLGDEAANGEELAAAGDHVGPYRLIREIGRGGMGAVWLAERADGSLKRQIALKLPRLAWGAGLAERMRRERDIGALLAHPNIARLYDAGVDPRGRPYLAFELIAGQAIDSYCETHGLGVPERLRLFNQVARAVAYAHGRLIVHRDLKPSNVLVTEDEQAHLLDFGIAKLLHDATDATMLTQEQGRVLTPHYASPEQIRGEPITVVSDVYSLGVLLYHLLTGSLPYDLKRKTLGALEEAILEGERPLASSRAAEKFRAKEMRGEVDAILDKALKRNPSERYTTAEAFADDIERHLEGEVVRARPDTSMYRLSKFVRKHRVTLVATGAVLSAVVVGSGLAVVHAQRAARASERERVVKEFVTDVFRVNIRVDPGNAELRRTTPQSLLESGVGLIQTRFANQPALQTDLFAAVGNVAVDMGDYRLAADYLTREVEALAVHGAPLHEQAKALLRLAQALLDDRRLGDSELRARRAFELARGDALLELDAIVLLARVQTARGMPERAQATLGDATSRLSALGDGPSLTRAWLLAARAELAELKNEWRDAIALYERGIDVAVAIQGLESPAAISMRLSNAFLLLQVPDSERAQQFFDSAIAKLHVLGGAHKVRASFVSARFAYWRHVTGHQSALSEAIDSLERAKAELTASLVPVPAWFVPQVDFWVGDVRAQAGDAAGGLPLMQANEEMLLRVRESPFARWEIVSGLGTAAMLAGEHELADAWLRKRLDLRRQFGLGGHPWAAFDHSYVAQNLVMAGRFQEAQEVLDRAPYFSQGAATGGADPQWHNRMLARTRAMLRLAQGDAAAALVLLEQDEWDAAQDTEDPVTAYRALMGEALCISGKTKPGLEMLNAQLSEMVRGNEYAHDPDLARLRAIAGLCALESGQRGAAGELRALAHSAFDANPKVSPYYKQPLEKLDRLHDLDRRRLLTSARAGASPERRPAKAGV
jgi:tetratricopeptide (TPR) repeat protein